MIKANTKLSFLVFFLASFTLAAQPADREVVNQSLEWFSTASNIRLSKVFTLYVEGQFRYADDFDPMQYQTRTSLDIAINKHWSLTPIGYVYTWNYQYGEQPAAFVNNEHRFYQQLVYKHKISNINISHRGRLEQRKIQDTKSGSESYSNHQTRYRYRFMATMPFKGEKISPKSWYAAVYDEVFMSRGESVTFKEPDQNRVFAGVGYQINHDFNILAGPLYQMLIKSGGAKQENNVGLQVMATYNFDLTRKE